MDAETRIASSVYDGLKPPELWRHFAALNAIPRPSGHEDAARRYVQEVARGAGAGWAMDAAGNMVVRIGASTGAAQDAPIAVIQSHLDMVCEARPPVTPDWLNDPVRPRLLGDEVWATDTTLGADNGIGAAAALALVTTPGLVHGPLELLFTVEEEVGLLGALGLDASMLAGRLLINLDSEDPEELTVGAAGGRDLTLTRPVTRRSVSSSGFSGWELAVSGLKGGHSGVQIAQPLANAVKVLTHVLRALLDSGVEFHVGELTGGSRSNAIPRTASARLAVADGRTDLFFRKVAEALDAARSTWSMYEPGLAIEAVPVAVPERAADEASTEGVVRFLEGLPHGVLAMSPRFAGKVQTSCNLAIVGLDGERLEILVSLRSLDEAGLDEAEASVRGAAGGNGIRINVAGGYPPWPPDPDAALCRSTISAYTEAYGHAPRVEVLHAGLECGVIAALVPGMQTISFGPRITSPHTPDEHVVASTVTSTWRVLTTLLEGLASAK